MTLGAGEPYDTAEGYSMNGKSNAIPHHYIDLTASPMTVVINSLGDYNPGTLFSDNSYLAGANPYSVPAIWGDQSDFVQSIDGTFHKGGAGGAFVPSWQLNTIDKLKQDWYHLWRGRDDISDTWPLGRYHPNRWIIDKAGAAKGYSGNGIWNDGTVSYMDLSYWGIGTELEYNRKNSHLELIKMNQLTEVAFADIMSTQGTQFRFKQDPDQTIYTITDVGVQDDIYNYEAPQGVWGVEDPATGLAVGGLEMGYQRLAPWGSTKEAGPLPGGLAFLSDLFSKEKKRTGGAPYNKRIRFTLTLDKIIGAEGTHGFHPITNHVDGNGVANIVNSRRKYNQSMAGGVLSVNTGATPAGTSNMDMFNLSSFWNTPAVGGGGSDYVGGGGFDGQAETYDAFVGHLVPGGADVKLDDQPRCLSNSFYTTYYTRAHIGLHERGLNETTIEVVTPYKGDPDSTMSTNPAVWETEPLEDVGLDIYYAASPTYPIQVQRYRFDNKGKEGLSIANGPDDADAYGANWYDYGYRGEEVIPVGAYAFVNPKSVFVGGMPDVCAIQNDIVWFRANKNSVAGSAFIDATDFTIGHNGMYGDDYTLPLGSTVKFTFDGAGDDYGAFYDKEEISTQIVEVLGSPTGTAGVSVYRIAANTHNKKRQLRYFNCYSYGTGVETNRIKDEYNAVTIDKGVKASMPLAEQYEEERRGSSLIFSGIYNSTSGVNSTNQFIQAEPITKDLNPINGTIQKLHTRDSDLVTFCENKVFRIFAQKDALFNADGNTNLTATNKVLGQAKPFTGEYGISKNPESFASESYRVYFSDKARGAILRLSMDGLTNISDLGMKDWFKDNLRFATSIIGSYDEREDQYNVTVETEDIDQREKAYTLSFTEARKGWVSFKSFVSQSGISHKNIYYTFPSNEYSKKTTLDPWGVPYLTPSNAIAEVWQHGLDIRVSRQIQGIGPFINTTSFAVNDNPRGSITVGMNIAGNGISLGTVVAGVSCNGTVCNITTDRPCSIQSNDTGVTGEVVFTTPRNSFYNVEDHYSMLKVLFNKGQGVVKRFKTLDYEGTQAKTIQRAANQYNIEGQDVGQVYYDNIEKVGWYAYHLNTDMQVGKVHEFIDKENKWYNFIRGYGTFFNNDSQDLQPAGNGIVSGLNFGKAATMHDQLETGAFSLQGLGFASTVLNEGILGWSCIDSNCEEVINGLYSTEIKCIADGCEDRYGCTNSEANNYDPLATIDDGTCDFNCIDCASAFADTSVPGCCQACSAGYNPLATCNDESDPDCQCFYGCSDPAGSTANNYNSTVIEDGSCTWLGCTDPAAANYDSASFADWTNYAGGSFTDDGSCTYHI